MTITYNDYIILDLLYTASSGGTVFSGNQKDNTSFDYFTDAAQNDDAIYFGFNHPRRNFGDVKFYIGTAFVATDVTFIWEYSNSSHTWSTLSVIDGTANFSNVGECVVSFTHPSDASYAKVNGIYSRWIRCRIVSVTGVTEGGAQSNQEVFVRGLGLTISDPGNTVTDFCESCYQASITNGWNIVDKIGDYSYVFKCHVYVGYSSDTLPTHLTDEEKHIEFQGVLMGMIGRPIFTFGKLVDEEKKVTSNGCSINYVPILAASFRGSGHDINKFYGSFLENGSPYGTGVAYNCIFNGSLFTTYSDYDTGKGPRFYNVSFGSRPDFISYTVRDGSLAERIFVSNTSYAVRMQYMAFVRNLININCPYWGNYTSATDIYDLVFIDTETGTHDIWWGNNVANGIGNVIGDNFSINLKVIDKNGNPIENAKIELADKNGDALFVERGLSRSNLYTTGTFFSVEVNDFDIGDYVKTGNEIIKLVSGSYPNFICERGQKGTIITRQSMRQIFKLKHNILTDSNGIAEEIIAQANLFYWDSGYRPGITKQVSFNPFTLKISKAGYKTYETTFVLDKKINWTVTLKRISINVDNEVIV